MWTRVAARSRCMLRGSSASTTFTWRHTQQALAVTRRQLYTRSWVASSADDSATTASIEQQRAAVEAATAAAGTRGLADRAVSLPRSGIRLLMELAAGREGVIHLEVGQPDMPPPKHVLEATHEALDVPSSSRYCHNAGVQPAREAVAKHVTKHWGVPTSGDNIIVSTGAVTAIAAAFASLINPGDEVLLPSPAWPNYASAATLLGATVGTYPMPASSGWLPTAEGLRSSITSNTKAVVLNNPSNPTGRLMPPQLVADMLDVCHEAGVYVVADEIYGDLVFDEPWPSRSCLSYCADAYDGVANPLSDSDPVSSITLHSVIHISGVSKSYSMTGFRVGYMRAAPELVGVAVKVQEAFVSCGVPFAQLGAVAALEGPSDCVDDSVGVYRTRRDAAVEVLQQYGMHEYTPEGAFYLLIDVEQDSQQFAHDLLNEDLVAVAPGYTFGDQTLHHVRVSLASSEEDLREGIARICRRVISNRK